MGYNETPHTLSEHLYWGLWKWVTDEETGKRGKKPCQANHPEWGAKTNAPRTWADFNKAYEVYRLGGFEGLCYAHMKQDAESGLTTWDFDGCFDEKGEVKEPARTIIEQLNTYTEYSPSGNGLHAICTTPGAALGLHGAYMEKPGKHHPSKGVEVYRSGESAHYMTFTGRIYGTPKPVAERRETVERLLDLFMRRDMGGTTASSNGEFPVAGLPGPPLTDEEVLAKAARNALNGAAFRAIFYDNDLSAYADPGSGEIDDSAADLALANFFTFYCGNAEGRDADQIERLMRQGVTRRDKWDSPRGGITWLRYTINRAIRDCRHVYDPASPEFQEKLRKKAIAVFKDADHGRTPAPRAINPASDRGRYSFTDKGNGNFFADAHRDSLRYVPQAKQWYASCGGRWVPDVGDCITRKCAKLFADYYWGIVPSMPEDVQEQAKKNAGALSSLPARERMLKDAQPEYPLKLEELDTDPDLFNCRNGTLNLVTMEFYPHRAADLISKMAEVDYTPGVDCPLWKATLAEIFRGQPELVSYLQKVLGYALTGRPIEKQFFILHGLNTNNGKSTIVQAIERLLGEYAASAPPSLIEKKRFSDSSRPSNDRARLAGVRFLSIGEPGNRMPLDEAYVKSITGRDTQTARFNNQLEFQYPVQFVLLMHTNHLPYISDCTLFRRGSVRVIPIERSFEEWEQDKTLIDKLQQPEELSGILNWLLEGLEAYQIEGLSLPLAAQRALTEYEGSSDNVQRFLEECTERDPRASVASSKLYDDFKSWCYREGLNDMTQTAFSEALKERGAVKKRTGAGWQFQGLKSTYSDFL